MKNQFILAKTIDLSLLVQQKSSVESSINDGVHQKKVTKVLSRYLYINRHQYTKKDTYHILLRVVHSGPSLQNRKKINLLIYKTICNLFWTRFNPRKTSYYSVPQLLLVTIVSIKQRVSLSSVNYD